MYVHELRIKNYSIHRDTHIELSPITVFVGPNGSGKSAIFDALQNFSMLSRGKIGQAFGPFPYSFAATRYRSANAISRIGFEVTMSVDEPAEERLTYKIDYSESPDATFDIHEESLAIADRVLFDRRDPDSTELLGALRYMERDQGILAAVRRAHRYNETDGVPASAVECALQISRFNCFRLDPRNLGTPSTLPDLEASELPRMEYEGGNLPSVLYYMQQTDHSAFEIIKVCLREVFPAFDDFEFNSVGSRRIGFSVRFTDGRLVIPAARLSDGQLLIIGLTTLVSSAKNQIPILMLEEPENGLTATAQRALYNTIRGLAVDPDAANRSQVLIASHSPFVVCEAWNGEDRDFIHQVTVRDGKAVVKSFSQAIGKEHLRMRNGRRVELGLKAAEEVMSGYLM